MDDREPHSTVGIADLADQIHPSVMTAVVERLDRDLDAMCDETLAAVLRERPDLGERLPPEVLHGAIRATHEHAIALLRGGEETAELRAQAVDLGRQAAHLGLGPDDVMAGYRFGADVANARTQAVLVERDAPAATVVALWTWSARF
jgi:hypothetical protein